MPKANASKKIKSKKRELLSLECPFCGADLKNVKSDTVCFCCGRKLKIAAGPAQKGIDARTFTPEPLYLPKGSIRALTAVLTALSSWILIFNNAKIPEYIFGLLLAIIGYYFGASRGAGASQTTNSPPPPQTGNSFFSLALAIRFFLVAGFIASAFFALKNKSSLDSNYIQFFGVFTGFVAGYIFARISETTKGRPIYNALNHIKGGTVIAAAIILSVMMISGSYLEHARLALFFSALISFYFGSKS
jgi:uncharacterized membrane protein YfcA